MKLTLYNKIWIIFLISLAVVIPILMDISSDYENIDDATLILSLVLMFYVIGGFFALIFTYILIRLKKQSEIFEVKIKQRPGDYKNIKKLSLKIYLIGSIMSLVCIFLIFFFNLSDETRILLVLTFMIISMALLSYLYHRQINF